MTKENEILIDSRPIEADELQKLFRPPICNVIPRNKVYKKNQNNHCNQNRGTREGLLELEHRRMNDVTEMTLPEQCFQNNTAGNDCCQPKEEVAGFGQWQGGHDCLGETVTVQDNES